MNKRIIILLLIFISIINITACSEASSPGEEGDMVVYTSIYPIYDFAKKIAGDAIRVDLLLPPGAEPHGWEPSARMMASIEKAQGFLYNGLDMDPWAERLAKSISSGGVHVLALGEMDSVQPMLYHGDHHGHGEHGHGTHDPHIWLDPIMAEEMAAGIRDLFIQMDEDNRRVYEENFLSFRDQLRALDQEYREALAQSERREFIVTHAAFGYLAQRYNLRQISITGLAPQAEPSSGKMAELIQLIREHNIPVVFTEELGSTKAARVLADEAGVSVDTIHPIGGLTKEEMDRGEDYLSIMRKNLEKLVKALN